MRPKKHEPTGLNDLFRARLDQIINMQHELVQLAGKIDWKWIDGKRSLTAPCRDFCKSSDVDRIDEIGSHIWSTI